MTPDVGYFLCAVLGTLAVGMAAYHVFRYVAVLKARCVGRRLSRLSSAGEISQPMVDFNMRINAMERAQVATLAGYTFIWAIMFQVILNMRDAAPPLAVLGAYGFLVAISILIVNSLGDCLIIGKNSISMWHAYTLFRERRVLLSCVESAERKLYVCGYQYGPVEFEKLVIRVSNGRNYYFNPDGHGKDICQELRERGVKVVGEF